MIFLQHTVLRILRESLISVLWEKNGDSHFSDSSAALLLMHNFQSSSDRYAFHTTHSGVLTLCGLQIAWFIGVRGSHHTMLPGHEYRCNTQMSHIVYICIILVHFNSFSSFNAFSWLLCLTSNCGIQFPKELFDRQTYWILITVQNVIK